ncbi:MAG: hypothetical protein H0U95_08975 [Bacteroidetes bacterium]|nr:hypothetical protein [Bacteroidota bacterium]
MNKLRFIFAFVFLAGMLFTVIQYIPVLEEETQNHNTELAKKSTEDDSTGSDSDETDNDGDDAIHHFLNYDFTALVSQTLLFAYNKDDYNSFFQKINIPPPKI